MLRLGEVEARRDELLRAHDPAALAAVPPARELAQGRARVAQPVVVVAPRDAVGVRDVPRSRRGRAVRRARRQRTDHAVHAHGLIHRAKKALEDHDRVGSRVDVHVEAGRPERVGEPGHAGPLVVVLKEDLDGVGARQAPHVGGGHPSVAREVEPQPAHRPDGDAMVGRPARIVRIVHVAALSGDDLLGYLPHIAHDPTPVAKTGGNIA